MNGNLFFVVALLCVTTQIVLGAPHRSQRDVAAEAEISPVNNNEDAAEGLNREKRKLVEPALQSKNAILGFVFGASKSTAVKVAAGASGASSAYSGAKAIFKTSSGSIGSPTKQPYKTTTDDTPDFDRNKVSLVVPDELFGNSFTLVTNVSKLMGDFIMNSARRTADFFVVLQPLLKKSLTIENPPPTTTTTESSSNEV